MKRSLHLAILLVLFGLSSARGGTIEGKIKNGTKGFTVPPNVTVALNRYIDNQADEKFHVSVQARNNGTFRFTDVPEGKNFLYEPMVIYRGIRFYGRPVQITKTSPQATSTVTLYETTREDSVLQVPIHHILMRPGQGLIQVQEMLVVENHSDRAYIGPGKGDEIVRTLTFRLPPGATETSLGTGFMSCCVQYEEGGFYDTMEILPGRKDFIFSYLIRKKDKQLTFTKTITINTQTLDVLISGKNVRLSGEGVKEVPVNDPRFKRFKISPVRAGTELHLLITGLPGAPKDYSTLLLILFGLLLIATCVFVYWRVKASERGKKHTINFPSEPQQEWIVQKIAELDEAYEKKKISEKQYREKRAALVALFEDAQ